MIAKTALSRETFSPKLDKIEENIIYLLSLDSKIPVKEVAKALGVGRKVAENRVAKLYETGAIKPLLIYNYYGLYKTTVLLRLSIFDEGTLSTVREISPIIKIKETLGMYDLSLLVITNNKREMDDILYRINKSLHNAILSMDIISHPIEDTMGYKSFCHKADLLQRYEMLSADVRISDDDVKVIDILKVNPHMSYKELIKKTGWTFKKLKSIIERLRRDKVIRFSVDPNYTLLDLEFHNILVKINLAKAKQFEANLMNNSRVHWVKRGAGRWDYILSVCAKNIAEFIDTSRKIRTLNKSMIFESSALVSKINVMRRI